MKNKILKIAVGLFSILSLVSIAACANTVSPAEATAEPVMEESIVEDAAVEESVEEESDEAINDFTIVDEEGNTDIDNEALHEHIVQDPDAELNEIEIEGLLFMREEEKLARDVYLTLYDIWQMNIFQNISRSEQTHTEAIKVLLDQFGLQDPMSTDEVGVFENQELQALYDDLVATGSQSLQDALLVGAAIEEIDILDLEEYIGLTDNVDLQTVYGNLTKRSRNHLRSFVSVYEKQTGETYAPQYLTTDAYDAIIESAMETSGQGKNGGGNGHGNGND